MATNVDSVQAILNGNNQYRLKQEAVSSGDIAEIDTSALAVYVGPDSDFTEYRLQYYDPQAEGQAATADFSVNGPLVGLLPALLATRYQSNDQPARLLCTTVDLYQPNYVRETGGIPANPSRTILIPPVIDVVFAFTSELPAVPAVRSDRTVRLVNVPFLDDGVGTDVLVPAYGRRLITVQALSADPVVLTFYKIVFQQGVTPDRPQIIPEQIFSGGLSIPILTSKVIRTSNDVSSYFDSVIPSSYEKQPTPGPIGTFDYLGINIQRNTVISPGAGVMRQLYVKLSDREV